MKWQCREILLYNKKTCLNWYINICWNIPNRLPRNPAPLLQAQIPRSNFGKDANVSPTLWVTTQKADITRRILEVGCWPRLGFWESNVANSTSDLDNLTAEYSIALLPGAAVLIPASLILSSTTPPPNNSFVPVAQLIRYLTKTTEVQRSGQITDGFRSG